MDWDPFDGAKFEAACRAIEGCERMADGYRTDILVLKSCARDCRRHLLDLTAAAGLGVETEDPTFDAREVDYLVDNMVMGWRKMKRINTMLLERYEAEGL